MVGLTFCKITINYCGESAPVSLSLVYTTQQRLLRCVWTINDKCWWTSGVPRILNGKGPPNNQVNSVCVCIYNIYIYIYIYIIQTELAYNEYRHDNQSHM